MRSSVERGARWRPRRSPRRSPSTAAACGGDDGSGGDDGGAVTIWSSLDQPVVDGIDKQMQIAAEEAGIEVNIEQRREHQPADHDQDPGQRHPRHRPHPAARRRRPSSWSSARPSRSTTCSTSTRSRSTMVPGALDAGTVDDQLYGLLVSMNVKCLVFYPKKAFEEAGYPQPESHRRAQRAHRADQGRRQHPVVHGHRVRHRHRLAATDWFEDLVMRYGGRRRLQRVGHPRACRSTPTWCVKRRPPSSRSSCSPRATCSVAAGHRQHQLRHRGRQPDVRRGEPGCWMLQAGLVLHHRLLPRGRLRRPRRRASASSGFPPAEAGGENPVLGGGDLAVLLSDSEDAKTVMNLLAETDIGNDAAPASARSSRRTRTSTPRSTRAS